MLPIPAPTTRPACVRRAALAPRGAKGAGAPPRRGARTPAAVPEGDESTAAASAGRRAALVALAAGLVSSSAKAAGRRVPLFADPVPGSRIGVTPTGSGAPADASATAPTAPAPPAPVSMDIVAARSVALSGLAASAVYAAVTGAVPAAAAAPIKECVSFFPCPSRMPWPGRGV